MDTTLICNVEESDTRLWLHVLHSAGTKKRPDTNVCLPHWSYNHKWATTSYSTSCKRSSLPSEMILISRDHNNTIPMVTQTVFISTGCDFVSFFTGIGKVLFWAQCLSTQTLYTTSGYHWPEDISLFLDWSVAPTSRNANLPFCHHFGSLSM